jgi:hypothetical protein
MEEEESGREELEIAPKGEASCGRSPFDVAFEARVTA